MLNEKEDFWIATTLFIATFSIYLSTNLTKPITPVLARGLGGNELEIAAILMVSIVVLALLQPLTGLLADRYGYLRMILIGGLLGAISSLLCLYVLSWQQLFVLKMLGGIADSISAPAILAFTASISEKRRGLIFGVFRSSQGLSFIIGPILGVIVSRLFTIRTPFLIDSIFTTLALILFTYTLRRKRVQRREEKIRFKILAEALRRRRILLPMYIGFSEGFSFAIWISFMPIHILNLKMTEAEIGTIISIEALAFTISSTIVGYLSDIIGRRIIVITGAIITTGASLAYLTVNILPMLILNSVLYGVGCAMIFLMSTVMTTDLIPKQERAMLLGALDALMDIGLIIGPSITWILLKITSMPVVISFIIAASSTAIAIPVAVLSRKPFTSSTKMQKAK